MNLIIIKKTIILINKKILIRTIKMTNKDYIIVLDILNKNKIIKELYVRICNFQMQKAHLKNKKIRY
jgi:hypothetical protein